MDPQFSGLFLNVLLGKQNQVTSCIWRTVRQHEEAQAWPWRVRMWVRLTYFGQRIGRWGDVTTHELLPGGSNIKVTSVELCIKYIQIRRFQNQEFKLASNAFNKGTRHHSKGLICLFSPRSCSR